MNPIDFATPARACRRNTPRSPCGGAGIPPGGIQGSTVWLASQSGNEATAQARFLVCQSQRCQLWRWRIPVIHSRANHQRGLFSVLGVSPLSCVHLSQRSPAPQRGGLHTLPAPCPTGVATHSPPARRAGLSLSYPRCRGLYPSRPLGYTCTYTPATTLSACTLGWCNSLFDTCTE